MTGTDTKIAEPYHVQVSESETRFVLLSDLRPSPENAKLYRPVDPTDPAIAALADSIGERGILVPLTVCADNVILAGHRRHTAAMLAGLDAVPCRVLDWKSTDRPDEFLRLLREHNRQRVKNFAELAGEAALSATDFDAHNALMLFRAERSRIQTDEIELGEVRGRCQLSKAKEPMLAAIQKALTDLKDFWPVSDRQLHYALLNTRPLIHASKPDSRYANDDRSYRALVDVLTRGRLTGRIRFASIADTTRPVTLWTVHNNVQDYIELTLDNLFLDYYRDYQQSQPNHVELVCEKDTAARILRPVAERYCIPFTIGRGYCSLPPRHGIAQRFRRSGKDKCIIIIASDFDPDGEAIAETFARSLRDDFDIPEDRLVAVKAALTSEQVKRFDLPPAMQSKKSSSRHKKFKAKHGTDVWELEALRPEMLSRLAEAAHEKRPI